MATANSYTILLVEDDPNDVLLIQRAFKTANINFPMQIVTDGEAAIAYLTETKAEADHEKYPQPVLVLLDLHLPRKSGFEVLAWLRQQPRWRRLPVVILTSSAESGGINHAYELGANTYLVKPVRFEDLVVLVRTLHLYWLILSEKPDVGSEFEKPMP